MNDNNIKFMPSVQHMQVQCTKKRYMHDKRLKKQSLKKVCSLCILFVVVVLLICLFGFFRVHASQEKPNEQAKKHYSSIVVQPKDNLWRIAEKYAQDESIFTYINNIKKLNNMNEDTIYAGKSIIVYYYE